MYSSTFGRNITSITGFTILCVVTLLTVNGCSKKGSGQNTLLTRTTPSANPTPSPSPSTGVADHLELVSGDSQSGTVAATLAANIKVRVVDSGGNPVSGTTVNFSIVSGGGSVGSASIASDASGLAETSFTLGTTAGAQSAKAENNSLPGTPKSITFSATANAATPSAIIFSTSPSASGATGVALSTQPVVTVKDTYGNTVSAPADTITLSAYTDAGCITSPASGTLSATSNPLSTTAGSASFTGVKYNRIETIHIKAVSGNGYGYACSTAIAVSPATFRDDGTISVVGSGTGGGFLSGGTTKTDTVTSGTGTAAQISLKTTIDSGTGADGSIDLSLGSGAGGCNGSGMSWNAGLSTCTVNTNTKSVFNFTTITIPTGTTLTASGATYLTLKATGDISVAGTVSLNGANGVSTSSFADGAGGAGAAGGSAGGSGGPQGTAGSGAGGGGNSTVWYESDGGGGGGFGGAGGHAGADGGAGGGTYDTANAGGSGGGGGTWNMDDAGNGGGGGGGGGGSLKILGGEQITITGIIRANGGAGGNNSSGSSQFIGGAGGGGSGGRISIAAVTTITNSGSITATGGNGGNVNIAGGGGGGGGGGGRITLQDLDGVIAGGGTISAARGTAGTGDTGSANGSNGVTTYLSMTYLASGSFVSDTIDFGALVNFRNILWSATIPALAQSSCTPVTGAGCAIKIQIAVNNDNATWNYVGADGTAGTYFTESTGDAVPTPFNTDGYRYIRYKAFLSTADIGYTPSLDDITIENYPH